MEPGHPFKTEELDILRSSQRRALRLIPNWIVHNCRGERGGLPGTPDVPDGDRPFAELQLRRLIDAELLPLLADLPLERFQAHAETEVLTEAVAPLQHMPDPHVSELAWERHAAATVQSYGKENIRVVTRVVGALVLADHLADDGYVDVRIA